MRRLHVVGAGVAGLSAALAAAARGVPVVLHEAAPQAGGRCRTVRAAGGFVHDNGTHVLLAANRRAFALLDRIGARDAWIEPEPDGLPIYDARDGTLRRVGLSPWSWLRADRRPAGLALADLPRLAALALALRDRPVGTVIGARPIRDSLVEPLTVAVLNTPVATASARRFGVALRRLGRPGAARLFVARDGLGPDLVEPALAALARAGGTVAYGARLKALEQRDGLATALVLGERRLPLEPGEAVVLALPPHEIGRLLPALPHPVAYEPIVNVHYRCDGPAAPRFVGLLGTLAQWALARPGHVSVTVSAAAAAVETAPDVLAEQVWREIVPALRAAGLPVPAGPAPEARVVKEKRATLSQPAGGFPVPPLRPCRNLALAGDWLTPLPATIEAAVRSGEAAVRALARRPQGGASPAPAKGWTPAASHGPPR